MSQALFEFARFQLWITAFAVLLALPASIVLARWLLSRQRQEGKAAP